MKSHRALWAVVCFLAAANMVLGGTIVYEITAYIDGRDLLVLQGGTVQWNHLDNAAVGRHGGYNYPTTVSAWLDGNQTMDQVQWIPQWSENPPSEMRFHATSSILNGLLPALPVYSDITSILVEKVTGRHIVELYASPTEENGGKLIVDLDDIGPGGTCWYTVRITVGYQGVLVPDVVGMPQEDAQSTIISGGFTVGAITEEYSDMFEAGLVIGQTPSGGTETVGGWAVDMVISLGKLVTVPDVTGMFIDDAHSTLESSELMIGIDSTGYSRSVPEQHILIQSPAAGQVVPAGTAVNLIVVGGQGWEDDPFYIWTAEQLNSIGQNPGDWGGYFKLMADIDMSAYTGTQYNIIGNESVKFWGVFDGNGHTISHLTFSTDTAVDYVGLFGYTADAVIKNLSIADVTIYTQGSYAGGLVGRQDSGAIINCHTTGSVTAENYSYSHAGGIAGMTEWGGTITDSSSTCQVTASTYYYECYAGGLVGWQHDGVISRCYTTGTATCSSTLSRAFAGGIAGSVECGGDIVISYSSCSAAASSQTLESYAGGLTGWIDDGVIRNSYCSGNATSTSAAAASVAGGLIGHIGWADVSKCYSIGTATANGSGENFAGGFAGSDGGSAAYACFWDNETTEMETSAGGDSVIGKTTAEMKTLVTFTDAGWDFTDQTDDDIWRMCADGEDYPRLNWESIDGDFACPAGVDSADLVYFFQHWLFTDCTADNNFCGGADMNASGNVDLADFAIFAEHWLEGILY